MSDHAWFVVCNDYTRGPFRTREIAERELASIERQGACQLRHTIVERTR